MITLKKDHFILNKAIKPLRCKGLLRVKERTIKKRDLKRQKISHKIQPMLMLLKMLWQCRKLKKTYELKLCSDWQWKIIGGLIRDDPYVLILIYMNKVWMIICSNSKYIRQLKNTFILTCSLIITKIILFSPKNTLAKHSET